VGLDQIAETLQGDTQYYAIGNRIETGYGAALIYNTRFKVWSCNMARDFDDGFDLPSIEDFFLSKGIGFCRAFVLAGKPHQIEMLINSGFRQTSSQIGFWIDRYEPHIDSSFAFEPVETDGQKNAYMELHRHEALEHKTPEDLIDSIGSQRLDKGLDKRMRWFLVFKDGKLAGSVGILLLEKSARIKNPYTLPDFRGQGIGANACHFVNKLAFDLGLDGISVYAQPNSGGNKLYSKMGFSQILEHKILMKP
jgi:GNAT superfamily N-acetyltransferase